jgi:hypothetical protein
MSSYIFLPLVLGSAAVVAVIYSSQNNTEAAKDNVNEKVRAEQKRQQQEAQRLQTERLKQQQQTQRIESERLKREEQTRQQQEAQRLQTERLKQLQQTQRLESVRLKQTQRIESERLKRDEQRRQQQETQRSQTERLKQQQTQRIESERLKRDEQARQQQQTSSDFYYVFAYGSLNTEEVKRDFRSRNISPDFDPPYPAKLSGYVRTFNGKTGLSSRWGVCSPATIVKQANKTVFGLIYKFNVSQMERIRRREGSKSPNPLDRSYNEETLTSNLFKIKTENSNTFDSDFTFVSHVHVFIKNPDREDYNTYLLPSNKYLEEIAKTIKESRGNTINNNNIIIDINYHNKNTGQIEKKLEVKFTSTLQRI